MTPFGLPIVVDEVVRASLERPDHRTESLFFALDDGAPRGRVPAVLATPPQRRVFQGTVRAPSGAPPLAVRLGDHEVAVDRNGAYRLETTLSGFLKLVAEGAGAQRECVATKTLELERAASRQDLTVTCEQREDVP